VFLEQSGLVLHSQRFQTYQNIYVFFTMMLQQRVISTARCIMMLFSGTCGKTLFYLLLLLLFPPPPPLSPFLLANVWRPHVLLLRVSSQRCIYFSLSVCCKTDVRLIKDAMVFLGGCGFQHSCHILALFFQLLSRSGHVNKSAGRL
jgi:hypothetical protein